MTKSVKQILMIAVILIMAILSFKELLLTHRYEFTDGESLKVRIVASEFPGIGQGGGYNFQLTFENNGNKRKLKFQDERMNLLFNVSNIRFEGKIVKTIVLTHNRWGIHEFYSYDDLSELNSDEYFGTIQTLEESIKNPAPTLAELRQMLYDQIGDEPFAILDGKELTLK